MDPATRQLLGLLAAALLVLVGSASPSAVSSEVQRPFKATVSGEVAFLLDNNYGLIATQACPGVASHLGRTDMTGPHCAPTSPDGDITLVGRTVTSLASTT